VTEIFSGFGGGPGPLCPPRWLRHCVYFVLYRLMLVLIAYRYIDSSKHKDRVAYVFCGAYSIRRKHIHICRPCW